jgi:hypothetical protein
VGERGNAFLRRYKKRKAAPQGFPRIQIQKIKNAPKGAFFITE